MSWEEIKQFLTSRNITDESFTLMEHEKIDPEIMKNMSDDDMKKYIPSHGDRIALRNFLQSDTDKNKTMKTPLKKKTVLERLREKLMIDTKSKSSNEYDLDECESAEKFGSQKLSRKRKLEGNDNAKKSERRVDIGWIIKEANGTKQVREKKGGGTRKVKVNKDFTKQDLINVATNLFFKNGSSPKGNKENFDFDLWDFAEMSISPTETVQKLYESFKVKIMRVYLVATPKVSANTTTEEKNNDEGQNIIQRAAEEARIGISDDDELPDIDERSDEVSVDTIQFGPFPSDLEDVDLDDTLPCLKNTPKLADITGVPNDNVDQKSGQSELVQADIFEVLDSEDEELNRALEASLTDNPTLKVHTEPTQITDLLKCFQSKVNNEDRQEIIVSRKAVLFSAFKALKRPRFCFSCKIYVKFSGEMGDDHGGPRREFFRLALMELVNSSLFEGKETSKIFSHNLEQLESEEYRLAGRLVALSLAQEGPGLYVMNPLLYDMMLGQDVNFMDFDLECLPDPDTKKILQQLKDADTDQKRDIFLSAHGDWIIEQGYSGIWRMKKEDRCYVLNCLLKQLVMYRTSAEIKQFCNGLDDVMGMWTTIQQNPRQWKALFCDDIKNQKLTKSCFEALYKINWSEPGSNKRSKEEDTIYSWEVFLQDVNDEEVDCTFKDILIFITGADHVPPGGFPSQITIDFYSENGRLPFSSTCTLSISLPRGIQNPEFTRLLLRSLKECVGFGKI